MGETIAILGCGAKKASTKSQARELYTGPLFRAARDHLEARAIPYAILSARWGLVAPWAQLEPYDVTVQQQRAKLGEAWPTWCFAQGSGLLTQLEGGCLARACGFPRAYTIEVHAGAEYLAWARELIAGREDREDRLAIEITAPLAGLEIGQRLAWYAQRRAPPPTDVAWWWPALAPRPAGSPAEAPVVQAGAAQLSIFGAT